MELVLYTYKEKYNPISHLCKIWCQTYSIDLEIVVSNYNWSSIGELPILRYNQYLFNTEAIIPFFQHIMEIDSDLSLQGKNTTIILKEFCINKLHAATLYSMWTPSEISKHFASYQGSLYGRMISWLQYPAKRYKTLKYLQRIHGIESSAQAFQSAESSHKLLSETLGDSKYFSSLYSDTERPHSIDFILYVYLFEEISNLSGHIQVEDSLNQYPNLKEFINTMKADIENAKEEKNYRKYLRIVVDDNWLKTRAHRLNIKIEPRVIDKDDDSRKKYITLCAGFFFAFLWFNK